MKKKEKAKWIRHAHILKKDDYECSACHVKTDKPKKVCPKCGAMMKGSSYDPRWVDELEASDALFDD